MGHYDDSYEADDKAEALKLKKQLHKMIDKLGDTPDYLKKIIAVLEKSPVIMEFADLFKRLTD